MLKIHCIVIARLKSKRLKKKCLLPLGEYNLTSFLIKRLKSFEYKNCELTTTFATSNLAADQELYDKIQQINYSYQGSPTDVIDRMLNADKKRNINCDYFLRVTADNPFTCPLHIQMMIDSVHSNDSPDYIAIPNLNTGLRSELIKANYLRKVHKGIKNTNNSEYMTFMLNRPDKANVLYLEPKVSPQSRDFCYTVDTKEQYLFIKKIVDNGFQINSDLKDLIEITKKIQNPIIDVNRAHKEIPKDIIKVYNCEWVGD